MADTEVVSRKHYKVVAAVILKDSGGTKKIFCAQRAYTTSGKAAKESDGKWEFPGGKIEEGETKQQALAREINEEFGAVVEVGDFAGSVDYSYRDFDISMDAFFCTLKSGELTLREHINSDWITVEQLHDKDWAPADVTIVKAVEAVDYNYKASVKILKTLDELGISYKKQEHPAIFSEKDGENIKIELEGTEVKNLFVKDKKHNYELITLNLHTHADLKKIAEETEMGRFSFCNAVELKEMLDITPGSVTPLCIAADKEHKVKFVIDKTLEGKTVLMHPLRNTATIAINWDDLMKFIKYCDHDVMCVEV